jgi:negative regulator of genetic competence, sporulation and motility
LADNKPIRQVDFNKVLSRGDNLMYRNLKCSETLYDHKKMDLYKKREQGILQFANSVVNRGDEQKPFERQKMFSNNTLPCRCRNPESRVTKKEEDAQQESNEKFESVEEMVERIVQDSKTKKLKQNSSSVTKDDAQKEAKKKNRERSSKTLIYDSNQKTYDYQGNPVMVGIDFRNTSLHERRGISLKK